MSDIFEELSKPFNATEVHWRVGSTNKKKFENNQATQRKGMPLAYLDARNVMARLDEAVGPGNWTDSYQEGNKRLFCNLGIQIDGEWVYKTDGAGDTDIESQKGGISDAFKRAAVKWGVGRYLYDCKTPWIELTEWWSLPNNFDGAQYLSAFSSKASRTKYWNGLKDAAAEDDSGKARELWDELNAEQQSEVWRDLSSGIRSTIKELLASTHTTEEAA